MINAGKHKDDIWGMTFSDCSRYEKEILLEAVAALKKAMAASFNPVRFGGGRLFVRRYLCSERA